MDHDNRRLIEDYLPIQAISEEAAGEPRTKGHISTMHIWRARRPLVACRAAVYGALVPADRFVPAGGSEAKKQSLGRANAARFVKELCQYPGPAEAISKAQDHIREAHQARTGEKGRPKVLDLFSGGGAIPLEAARLGCESHAIELNPVAHIIELCTLVFPQKYGPKLADEVEAWGELVLKRTYERVKDLYPVIVPKKGGHRQAPGVFTSDSPEDDNALKIVAFYWTRTIPCPNAQCRGTVPLYRQSWLRKKASGYVALKPERDLKNRRIRFKVVQATSEAGLGFDPGEGSENSSTECPFCRAPVPGEYVRTYGDEKGFGQQLMCVIALNPEGSGKIYLTDETLAEGEEERQARADKRAAKLEQELGPSSLGETIPPTGNAGLATGKSYLYGIKTFQQAFTPRQRCVLLTMAQEIRKAHAEMLKAGQSTDRASAITTYLGLWLSRLTDRFCGLSRWDNSRENIQGATSLKRFAMAWDFPEVSIFGGASGDAMGNLEYITAGLRREGAFNNPVTCKRGSASELPFEDATFDAVVTDPPYYDNESYSELSDVCYIWMRPTIGFLYPEHFGSALTPKKKECVAAAYRQGGKEAAKRFYEDLLFKSLREANRVTKPGGALVLMYAHKTTSGWATLVDATRRAGYEVTEAWPLDTETKERVAHQGDAALASSIFLVARKRGTDGNGSYEEQVRPELERIVKERVETLWSMGIAGADLVIAAVGAGLKAYTRFGRVEYANGEEVPAEKYLAEVEGLVLETLLEKLFGISRSGVASVDGPSRFYVLWRYTYKAAELEAGEAIVFTYSQPVELDGQNGLTAGSQALIEKKKNKYRIRDFTERGNDEKLGLPERDGTPAPQIDVLHRLLWLLENAPRRLGKFLEEADPDVEHLRLVAQALAGTGLSGMEAGEAERLVTTTPEEQSALGKLLANWRALIERTMVAEPGTLWDERK